MTFSYNRQQGGLGSNGCRQVGIVIAMQQEQCSLGQRQQQCIPTSLLPTLSHHPANTPTQPSSRYVVRTNHLGVLMTSLFTPAVAATYSTGLF
jgi:hypothetical protein